VHFAQGQLKNRVYKLLNLVGPTLQFWTTDRWEARAGTALKSIKNLTQRQYCWQCISMCTLPSICMVYLFLYYHGYGMHCQKYCPCLVCSDCARDLCEQMCQVCSHSGQK
jgi:hypothetical protein